MWRARTCVGIAALGLWLGACAKPVTPTFLEQKTGIALAERAECGSGLTGNELCAPERFGRAEWRKSEKLPPYAVSVAAVRSGDHAVIAEVRAHYVGSPFYEGDVHAVCKQEVSTSALPMAGTSVEDFDLGLVLQDRAVRPLTMEFRAALESAGVARAGELARRFGAHLKSEVRRRVHARVLWFVTRYPGGRTDLVRNPELRSCVKEQERNDAWLVTGVAGYIVLRNRVDGSIDSPRTISSALDYALRGYDDVKLSPEAKHGLQDSWVDRVESVALIKEHSRDLGAMAWPLWIQFEKGPRPAAPAAPAAAPAAASLPPASAAPAAAAPPPAAPARPEPAR